MDYLGARKHQLDQANMLEVSRHFVGYQARLDGASAHGFDIFVAGAFERCAIIPADPSRNFCTIPRAGTALIASIGIIWFKEPINTFKIGSIVLIVIGIVGLNMSMKAPVQ